MQDKHRGKEGWRGRRAREREGERDAGGEREGLFLNKWRVRRYEAACPAVQFRLPQRSATLFLPPKRFKRFGGMGGGSEQLVRLGGTYIFPPSLLPPQHPNSPLREKRPKFIAAVATSSSSAQSGGVHVRASGPCPLLNLRGGTDDDESRRRGGRTP